MIKVSNVDKSFDGHLALSNLNLNIKKGSIYGLVGTNGAGKTTLIKHVTGVLKQDKGNITIEDEPIYENTFIKERMGYIPDIYIFLLYNLKESARFIVHFIQNGTKSATPMNRCSLDEGRKLSKFSKECK